MKVGAQEPRPERLAVAVTAHEKRAAEVVARALNTGGVSNLLRVKSVTEIVELYDAMMAAMHAGEAREAA